MSKSNLISRASIVGECRHRAKRQNEFVNANDTARKTYLSRVFSVSGTE